MDLTVHLEKVDSAGQAIIRETYPGGAAPTRTASYLRVSRRALDPVLSTEIDPVLLLQSEQLLSPVEVVPVEIGIWPLAMKFHRRATETHHQTLQQRSDQPAFRSGGDRPAEEQLYCSNPAQSRR